MQRRGDTPAKTVDDPEARLSAYFADYAAQNDHRFTTYLLRRPRDTVQALRDLARIAVLPVDLGGSPEGRLVACGLPRTARGPRSLAAALALPATPEAYSAGASKQTLRRKVRAAERAGVTWHAVTDPEEKRRLFDLANQHERTHPLQQYRRPSKEDTTLLEVDLWLVALAPDGHPLLVSITPVTGTAALLGMFRALEITDEASNARYLMTKVLAEHLIARGVTHLFDAVHPASLTNGLRHFQRMVGFRLVRVDQTQAGEVRQSQTVGARR